MVLYWCDHGVFAVGQWCSHYVLVVGPRGVYGNTVDLSWCCRGAALGTLWRIHWTQPQNSMKTEEQYT